VDDVDGSASSSPTNLRAYGADDDKAHSAISVLYSVWVTLTNHYWVTSDERRRKEPISSTSLEAESSTIELYNTRW
jgi:hypothetical protein